MLGRDNIPTGQFNGTDTYLYYWQAEIVAEDGRLPPRDMHRWLPLGRDLGQTLNLYSYAVAYTYKCLTLFFPTLTLYDVMLVAPVICFVLSLGVLCCYLYHVYGLTVSGIVGVLLATLPVTILRSIVGFSDRDSWCLLLGVAAVTTYLWKSQTQQMWHRYLLSAISGGLVFFGGLSWEGFGVFVNVILFSEVWRFLTSEKENCLGEYLLWLFIFVPTLPLASPAYRSGAGFSTHLTALVLLPPLVLLMLRYLRHLLITTFPFSNRLRPHARIVAFLFIIVSLLVGTTYIFSQRGSFEQTTVPFSDSHLMQTVSELKDASYPYWILYFGGVFLLGNIGLLVIILQRCEKVGTVLVFPIVLFILTTFFRGHLNTLLGESLCDTLFLTSLVLILIVGLSVAWLRKEPVENEHSYVAILVWFLIWAGLSRGAGRYGFFAAFPLTFFTADLVQIILDKILEKTTAYRRQDSQNPTSATIQATTCLCYERFSMLISAFLKGGITVVVLAALLFWAPMGKHASRIVAAATQTHKPFPGHGATKDALDWMKIALEKKHAVVAASWEYGSLLNVLGGVKTVIDQDHFIPYWIHLYCRHVFAARSSPEALEFLNTHSVTHLMLIEDDLLENTGTYSYVGSHENLDRFGNIVEMVPQDPAAAKYQMVPSLPNTPLEQINIDFDEDKLPETLTVQTFLKSDKVVVDMPYIAFFRKKRFAKEVANASEHGGVFLYFDNREQLNNGYYISPNGWNFLAVRLFFRGVQSPHFVPVYPEKEFSTAKVKVWEIHYPPDIRAHPKYRATAPKE